MPEDLKLQALIATYRKQVKPKRRHDETTLNGKLIDAAPKLKAKLYRNNRGAYQTKSGAWIRYGLGNQRERGSDLIGWRELKITADMVGSTVAQFLAVETKSSDGRASTGQNEFIIRVQAAGGIAQIVRSEQELEVVLKGKR